MALGKLKTTSISTGVAAQSQPIKSLNGVVLLTLLIDGTSATGTTTVDTQTQNFAGTWIGSGSPTAVVAGTTSSVSYPTQIASARAARINVTAVGGGTLACELIAFET